MITQFFNFSYKLDEIKTFYLLFCVSDKKVIQTFSNFNFVIISMSDSENDAKNVFIP